MARRLGCLLVLALVVLGAAGAALVWLLLSAVGAVGSAPAARAVSVGGLLVGLLALAAAWVALRRLAAPAGRLVAAARRIEEGDYSARVPVRGPSELRTLARAFNAMSGRLEAEEARRRSVLADVAHELRTPITVIRAQAEGIVDGVYPPTAAHLGPVLAATRTLEVLVDDLRTLALAEAGALSLQREAVDVSVLAHETVDTFTEGARASGVRLAVTVTPPGLVVDADPVRLRSVLANLVGNALRYVERGGAVEVSAASLDGAVRIAVRDTGAGMPPELLPRAFERFVKGPDSPGSGLGLAIVRDIVEAHGGAVSLTSGAGAGTTVTVTLPSTPPG